MRAAPETKLDIFATKYLKYDAWKGGKKGEWKQREVMGGKLGPEV